MTIYERYVIAMYENASEDYRQLAKEVINKLKIDGTSKATKRYLQSRKWDMTNDYMLDSVDAVESYIRRNSKPSYKHACAVLLEGKY